MKRNPKVKVQNPKFKERIEKVLGGQHFMNLIGFKLTEISPGFTSGIMQLTQDYRQQKGLAHGGIIATIADITTGFAAYTVVPKDYHVVTGELKISYLNPGLGTQLRCEGWVLKQGRKVNFCEAEVWDLRPDGEVLIAKASATMVTIFPGELDIK